MQKSRGLQLPQIDGDEKWSSFDWSNQIINLIFFSAAIMVAYKTNDNKARKMCKPHRYAGLH